MAAYTGIGVIASTRGRFRGKQPEGAGPVPLREFHALSRRDFPFEDLHSRLPPIGVTKAGLWDRSPACQVHAAAIGSGGQIQFLACARRDGEIGGFPAMSLRVTPVLKLGRDIEPDVLTVP